MSCTTVWHDFIIDNESIRCSLLQILQVFVNNLRQKAIFDADKCYQIYGEISWAF